MRCSCRIKGYEFAFIECLSLQCYSLCLASRALLQKKFQRQITDNASERSLGKTTTTTNDEKNVFRADQHRFGSFLEAKASGEKLEEIRKEKKSWKWKKTEIFDNNESTDVANTRENTLLQKKFCTAQKKQADFFSLSPHLYVRIRIQMPNIFGALRVLV